MEEGNERIFTTSRKQVRKPIRREENNEEEEEMREIPSGKLNLTSLL